MILYRFNSVGVVKSGNSMGNHQKEFAIKGCAVSAFQFADKKRPLVADTK